METTHGLNQDGTQYSGAKKRIWTICACCPTKKMMDVCSLSIHFILTQYDF